jgi:tetratricopeptide (TPR) repeat protein
VRQYHDLKAAEASTYNFDEDELNNLGYELIRAKKFKEGIRVLQLNVEAYPQSSNVYDSLGEAYMDDGNKPLAIANYQKSLDLNPKNRGAVVMLQKLKAP